jgi:hypothetical protein
MQGQSVHVWEAHVQEQATRSRVVNGCEHRAGIGKGGDAEILGLQEQADGSAYVGIVVNQVDLGESRRGHCCPPQAG